MNKVFQISVRSTVEVKAKDGLVRIQKNPKEENYAPPKFAEYSTIVWAEAVLQFEDWKEIFKTTNSVKRKVFEDMYFVSSIWDKNGIRYSGIHALNSDGDIIPGSGVNLDNYEWNNVFRKAEDINVALYGSQGEKGEKRSFVENELDLWSYGWFLNGNPVDTKSADLKFFTEADARKYAESDKPPMKISKKDKLEMKITHSMGKRPEETMQMRSVLVEVMNLILDWCKFRFCEACQLNPPAPGQKAHMVNGGCLDPEMDHISEYAELAYAAIEYRDLMVVYNSACRHLGIAPQGSMFLAKGALEWIPLSELIELVYKRHGQRIDDAREMMNPILSPLNAPLRDVIRQITIQIGVADKVGKRVVSTRG